MPKSLNPEQQDLMYQKRREQLLDFENLATILNTQEDHMVHAQIGKAIPDEVADAVIMWIES